MVSAAVAASLAILAQPAIATPVRFVASGDFGTGSPGQWAVADAMKKICDARGGCDFALGLGDNVYEVGVADECDAQFQTKFEAPYQALGLTWYMSLGNHDNSHDPVLQGPVGAALAPVGEAVADLVRPLSDDLAGLFEHPEELGLGHWYPAGNREVDYHYRSRGFVEEGVDSCAPSPCPPTGRWYMPLRFYTLPDEAGQGAADFFALDTNTLMYMGMPFPPDARELQRQVENDVLLQELWIDGALAQSAATWKIAFGHHPYRSNGSHGNAGFYEGAPMTPVSGPYVKAFYERHVCGKVDLLIVGHDHDLQWLEPVASCGGTEFIVSGAGAKTRAFECCESPPCLDRDFFRECNVVREDENGTPLAVDEELGFFWLEIDGGQLTAALYTVVSDDAEPPATTGVPTLVGERTLTKD
ncbi:MAG: metallophosphoesterase [Candidatus Binatia bacterium]